jgi:hypothetical protein
MNPLEGKTRRRRPVPIMARITQIPVSMNQTDRLISRKEGALRNSRNPASALARDRVMTETATGVIP